MAEFQVAVGVWVWIVGAFVAEHVAREKGRIRGSWFAVSLVASPLLALIALAGLPQKSKD